MKSTRILRLVLMASLIGLAGCAYFNTLYNAKNRFKEAERQPLDRDGHVTRQAETAYQEVIDKCHKMIRTWPDSRHVDDARLLIAQSYFGSERYERAVAAVDTLMELHPKTDLRNKALSVKGIALANIDRHEEAVDVLIERVEKHGPTPRVLYSLCTSLMSVDRSEDAVRYLDMMVDKYGNEPETFDAQVTIAEILDEKGELERSREVYQRTTAQRIPEAFRYRVWMGYADVSLKLEQHDQALAALANVEELTLTPEEEPPALLRKASAHMGAKNTDAAIKTYKDVAGRFSRGEYAAEAHYRLGRIYEAQDSLETAQREYSGVSRAYANSDYSQEALRRANNLSQLQKLQEAAGDDSPEAEALRTFSMAELQLLQFEDVPRALSAYEKILSEYPDTEYGPRAAYAVGYIYGVLRSDSARAWDAYSLLKLRYPDSQQAQYARRFLIGDDWPADSLMTIPPPMPVRQVPDSTMAPPPVAQQNPDSTKIAPATARQKPDSAATKPAPAPQKTDSVKVRPPSAQQKPDTSGASKEEQE